MMRRAYWGLGVVLAIFGGSAACLGDGIAEPPAVPNPLQMVEDIQSLVLIVGLKLTDDQIDRICALYAAKDGWFAQLEQDKNYQQIKAMRARLIRGEVPDLQELGALNQIILGEAERNVFLEQVEKILTPAQMAELAQPFRAQMQAAAAKGAPAVEPVLQRIGPLRGADDDVWVTETNKLADMIAEQAGAKGTPAYQQTRQNFVDFLERVRKMNDKQFAEGNKELLENLRALVPKGFVMKDLIPPNPTKGRPLTMFIFINPRVGLLLQEMKAARQNPAPLPAPAAQ